MLTYTLKDIIVDIFLIEDELLILYGDNFHDDSKSIQFLLDKKGYVKLPRKQFRIKKPIELKSGNYICGS